MRILCVCLYLAHHFIDALCIFFNVCSNIVLSFFVIVVVVGWCMLAVVLCLFVKFVFRIFFLLLFRYACSHWFDCLSAFVALFIVHGLECATEVLTENGPVDSACTTNEMLVQPGRYCFGQYWCWMGGLGECWRFEWCYVNSSTPNWQRFDWLARQIQLDMRLKCANVACSFRYLCVCRSEINRSERHWDT